VGGSGGSKSKKKNEQRLGLQKKSGRVKKTHFVENCLEYVVTFLYSQVIIAGTNSGTERRFRRDSDGGVIRKKPKSRGHWVEILALLWVEESKEAKRRGEERWEQAQNSRSAGLKGSPTSDFAALARIRGCVK